MTREKRTIEVMMKMHCSGHPASEKGFCRECQELLDYAGPRMILKHPILAAMHGVQGL